MCRGRQSRHGQQPAIRLARERLDRALDVAGTADVGGDRLDRERWGDAFERAQKLRSETIVGVVTDQRHPLDAGRDLLKQLQPFPDDRVLERREPGDIATWFRQIRNEAAADRVGDVGEDDRDGAGFALEGLHHRSDAGEDQVARSDELGRVFLKELGVARGPAVLEADVVAFLPAELLHRLPERREPRLRFGVALGSGRDDPDPPHPVRLLRARRERPRRRRAAEQCDELASFHSITSSAIASSPGGKLMPNAPAVLRLITNSNLIDCMTGRSAGFSPLRIRPVYTPAWRYASLRLVP